MATHFNMFKQYLFISAQTVWYVHVLLFDYVTDQIFYH